MAKIRRAALTAMKKGGVFALAACLLFGIPRVAEADDCCTWDPPCCSCPNHNHDPGPAPQACIHTWCDCDSSCGPQACAGTEVCLDPPETTVCVRQTNPAWTNWADWAHEEFGIDARFTVSDKDVRECNSDQVTDGNWTLSWSSAGIDLTTAGTYYLTATFTNTAPPSPPSWAADPPINLTYTITVIDCCEACEDCPGEITEWKSIEDEISIPSCGPDDTWPLGPEDDVHFVYDSCYNKLRVTCDGQYHFWYNGEEIGQCIWLCGLNRLNFTLRQTPCGNVFDEVFHRTIDTRALAGVGGSPGHEANCPPPENNWFSCDCGPEGLNPNAQLDWKDTSLELCIYGPTPLTFCCTAGTNTLISDAQFDNPDFCPTNQDLTPNCDGCGCPE